MRRQWFVGFVVGAALVVSLWSCGGDDSDDDEIQVSAGKVDLSISEGVVSDDNGVAFGGTFEGITDSTEGGTSTIEMTFEGSSACVNGVLGTNEGSWGTVLKLAVTDLSYTPSDYGVVSFQFDVSAAVMPQLQFGVDAADGNHYCTLLRLGADSVELSSLKKDCWDQTVEELIYDSSVAISGIMFTIQNSNGTDYDFCIDSLAATTVGVGNSDDSSDGEDWSAWTDSCNETLVGDLDVNTTWHWQLTGDIDHDVNVEMYDIDMFNTSAAEIATLQTEGRYVICYFSAGTWEEWRDDADQFNAEALGKTMEEWDDEKWLDVRHASTREMAQSRLDIAVSKGCDGVEPDNMDAYVNKSGFDLSGYDQLSFNKFVAVEAHKRGLSVGLKNDVDQLEALEGCFDWALNEECYAYDECGKYAPFLSAGKAVFHTEYVDKQSAGEKKADKICGSESVEGFSTLIKVWDLTEWYRDCL